MSLTFIRSALVIGALTASLLGAGLVNADDGDVPADAPVEVAALVIDGSDDGSGGEDSFATEPFLMSKGALESALTSVLSTCRSGLIQTKVTVIHNDIDPSSGYILMSEITEVGRTAMEKLDASVLESCFKSMDVSMIDKAAMDAALETIMTEMEALLAMP